MSREPEGTEVEPRFHWRYLRATLLAMGGFGTVIVGLAWAVWGLLKGAKDVALTGLFVAGIGAASLAGGIALVGATRRREVAWYRARGKEPPGRAPPE